MMHIVLFDNTNLVYLTSAPDCDQIKNFQGHIQYGLTYIYQIAISVTTFDLAFIATSDE